MGEGKSGIHTRLVVSSCNTVLCLVAYAAYGCELTHCLSSLAQPNIR